MEKLGSVIEDCWRRKWRREVLKTIVAEKCWRRVM